MEPVTLYGIEIKDNKDMLEALSSHCGDDEKMAGAGYFDNYPTAVIGFTEDARIVYSYERMAQSLVERDGMGYDEACEFIDYNAIRTLPFMGRAPVICYAGYGSAAGKETAK